MVESTATETVLNWTGESIQVNYTDNSGVKTSKELHWTEPSNSDKAFLQQFKFTIREFILM